MNDEHARLRHKAANKKILHIMLGVISGAIVISAIIYMAVTVVRLKKIDASDACPVDVAAYPAVRPPLPKALKITRKAVSDHPIIDVFDGMHLVQSNASDRKELLSKFVHAVTKLPASHIIAVFTESQTADNAQRNDSFSYEKVKRKGLQCVASLALFSDDNVSIIFPFLKVEVLGKKGRAVLWHNVSVNGAVDSKAAYNLSGSGEITHVLIGNKPVNERDIRVIS